MGLAPTTWSMERSTTIRTVGIGMKAIQRESWAQRETTKQCSAQRRGADGTTRNAEAPGGLYGAFRGRNALAHQVWPEQSGGRVLCFDSREAPAR